MVYVLWTMFSFSVKYAFEIESSGTITRLYIYISVVFNYRWWTEWRNITLSYGVLWITPLFFVSPRPSHSTGTIEPHTSLYPLTIHYPPPHTRNTTYTALSHAYIPLPSFPLVTVTTKHRPAAYTDLERDEHSVPPRELEKFDFRFTYLKL